MSIDVITEYIDSYGYIILFICLFFGIVGVPAPEESLLFLTGILIRHQHLAMSSALIYSELGAFIGMLTAYSCGKYLGKPFVNRYGKYVGLTKERWSGIESRYKVNGHKAITFGFYLPGVRQISPYFAGIAHFPFRSFILFSLIGSVIWTIPIILVGYYTAKVIYINPKYVPYFGLLLFVPFLAQLIVKKIRNRQIKT